MMQHDLFTYPQSPGFKREGTSRDAAADIAARAPVIRERVFQALKTRGPMTPDECGKALGLDRGTVRPRFSELVLHGRIRETGERRKNNSGKMANVYEVTS